MSLKLIIAFLSFGVVTYAFGRYAAPVKTVTEIKTVEVEKKTSDTDIDRNKHRESVTHEKINADGSKESTTTVTEDTNTRKDTTITDSTDRSTESKATIEYYGGTLSISALAGTNLFPFTPVYGGHIQARVIGPFTAGIWGTSNGVAGISIGLVF